MKKMIVCGLFLSVFFVSIAFAQTGQKFDQGTAKYRYKAVLVPDGITWNDADKAAKTAGGYLAVITSAEENTYVYSLVANDDRFWTTSYHNGNGPWLGGFKLAGSSSWAWANGEPFTYTNWAPRQPSNSMGKEDKLHFFGYQVKMGPQWDDLAANAMMKGYVIEFDAPVGIQPPQQSSTVERFVRVRSKHSNKCMDVAGAGTQDSADVIQYTCHGGDNQAWRFVPRTDGYYTIIAKHSNKCLDVIGGYNTDSANIYQWTCHGGDNQAWKLTPTGDGYYKISAKHSGKCVDVAGWSTNDGGDIIQYTCHGGNNQLWKLE